MNCFPESFEISNEIQQIADEHGCNFEDVVKVLHELVLEEIENATK